MRVAGGSNNTDSLTRELPVSAQHFDESPDMIDRLHVAREKRGFL